MKTPFLQAPLDYGCIWPVRTTDDFDHAVEWLDRYHGGPVAVDTETTGLDFHADVRLVQFGAGINAFVFDPAQFPALLDRLLKSDRFVAHNAAFDLLHLARLVSDAQVISTVQDLGRRTIDTSVLAHLLDPREKVDGGIGHGLKALAQHHVLADAPDADKALKARFKELGLRASTGWASIPRWDETYVRYSGTDVLLTSRLHQVLAAEVGRLGLSDLCRFEHSVQVVTMMMTARGFSVDLPYGYALAEDLATEQEMAEARAAELGVSNINSTAQVAATLTERGVNLTELTQSGAIKVDKVVLGRLDDELARTVLAGKAAAKSLATYVQPIIDSALGDGRVHCRIRSLAARTGRQSITNPPLQQLPSGDHRVRSMLIADPGQQLVAADFSQIEFRVLASLANEPEMIAAFNAGLDLHDTTATRLFGDGFSPDQRRLAKGVGFGLVYGGGVDTLSRQSGVLKTEAKVAIDKFKRSYPRISRWSNSLTESIKFGDPLVVTSTGRRIPVDRRFGYRAVNYVIQSTAADLFKGSLLELDAAGFGPHLLLPIHDEIIAQAPEGDAAELAADMASTMSGQLGPVPITADAELVGAAWGHKYNREVAHV